MGIRQPGIESFSGMAATPGLAGRRRGNRLALQLKLLVRPAAEFTNDFEEECTTVNIARDGFYFLCSHAHYRRGMQLNVTWVYSPLADSPRPNYVGKIVRVDPLDRNCCGIAVHLVQPIFA